MSEEPIKIFFSYSRKDLDMRNALEDHLAALREAGKISTWHDLELEAGTEWEPAILHKLDTADIILLLVSRNFIASKYCYGTELKRAIAHHDAGTARVIPIILRPCDWNHPDVPFSKLNVLPTHAKPITSWPDQEEAFAIVAQKIRETVEQLIAEKQAKQQAAEQARRQAEAAEQQRWQQERRQAEAVEQQRREAAQRQQTAQTQLASEKGVDYSRLRDLLKAGKWKEADRETADRMCEVMGRQAEGWLRVEDIQNFPCTDLRTIDHLWVTHSQSRFGFSVQKNIWRKCNSPIEYNSDWEKFGSEVGWLDRIWKVYRELTFDISSPEGHLPAFLVYVASNGSVSAKLSFTLLSRIQACGLNVLLSEKGIDYTRLSDLLQMSQWKEADQETTKCLCEVMGRHQEGWLRTEDFQKLPCTDLRTIDQLWINHSNGHFGFSVQKKIWEECGEPTESGNNWNQFCFRVGWKARSPWKTQGSYVNYSALKFDPLISPKGELPFLRGIGEYVGIGKGEFAESGFFSRVKTCKI